jgi:hypothetical protein
LQPLNGSMPWFPPAPVSPSSESARSLSTTTASRKPPASSSADGAQKPQKKERATPRAPQDKTAVDDEFCRLLQSVLDKPASKPGGQVAQPTAGSQAAGSRQGPAELHVAPSRQNAAEPQAASSTDPPASSRTSLPQGSPRAQEPLARQQRPAEGGPERHDEVSRGSSSSRRRRQQPMTIKLCCGIVQLNLCGGASSSKPSHTSSHNKHKKRSGSKTSVPTSAAPTPRS